MAAERGPEPVGGPGEALFRFVRHWSRRSTSNDLGRQGRLVVVLEAVTTLAQHGDVTVNAIASEVAVDQSGISRTLTEAAHAGLVDITSASGDRRHRTVSLTAGGRDVLADAHAWQESAFRQLTDGWDETEREDFHRRLDQLIERSQTLTRASGLT